ncbi:MAG TPA: PHP domain-containing protein [Chryseolinea sp.]|nr:PHP domain-containing protein [Chryseolinea sp.]
MKLSDLLSTPNGARFFRADLHIHSYGASHDVKDVTMTPEAIVRAAIAEKLEVIAITDHNEITNVASALKAAEGQNLLVIPAIELSTPECHLLCYFKKLDPLQKLFGRVNIVDRGTPKSRCQNSVLDCLNIVEQLGGLAILAHVDSASGYEYENPGASPHKLDVVCHKALLGIELKSAASDIFYSDGDTNSDRKHIGRERIKRLGLGSSQYLARLLNSDAHTLNALGRNASGDKRVTRIKMDNASFESFHIALEEGDARIRIEDQIPLSIPRIAGLNFEGGFLHAQQIHFSANLNCIIGGRGTGKSTTFEAARCLKGDESDNQLVDCEIWPNNITFFWCDQAGQYHTLKRAHASSLTNVDNPDDGPIRFQIECYSQGETEKISKNSQTNPIALLSYLDRFVDVTSCIHDENQARNELLEIQEEITKATNQVNQIPQVERSLAVTQQQLSALEKAKAKEVIELSRQLANEREIQSQVSRKMLDLKAGVENLVPNAKIEEIITLTDPKLLKIGGQEFKGIIASAKQFEKDVSNVQSTATAGYGKMEREISKQIVAWKSKESSAQRVIDEKRKELATLNIPLDMLYIQKLANSEAKYLADLNTLKTWKPYLEQKRKLYKDVSKRRWHSREKIAMTRNAYGKTASEALRSALTDLTVSLKYHNSSYSPEAEEQIKQAMSWRTIQVPRAALLIQQLTMPGLLKAIDSRESSQIMSVKTNEGTPVFNNDDANRIIQQLSVPEIRFALERCQVFDLPQLIVTKLLQNPTGGPPTPVSRDFAKLSLGQQQSVLLALMLSSKSNSPLIIDQPEDNLDGEFIYQSLVPVLRMAKERRQIIIVTHNANIAVLGDAEQIIVLKSTNEKSVIVSRGSIDDPKTRDLACGILEGAKEAFQRRSKIYGIS